MSCTLVSQEHEPPYALFIQVERYAIAQVREFCKRIQSVSSLVFWDRSISKATKSLEREFPSCRAITQEENVGKLYRIRVAALEYLRRGLQEEGNEEATSLQEALDAFDYCCDQQYLRTSFTEEIPSLFQVTIQALDRSCVSFLSSVLLRDPCVLRSLQRCLFAENWLQRLTRRDLTEETFLELLDSGKREYMTFFIKTCTPELCQEALVQHINSSPTDKRTRADICLSLEERYSQAQVRICEEERGRWNSADSLYAKIRKGIDHSDYVELARMVLECGEDITASASFQHIPVLKERLSPELIKPLSRLGGALFLGVDLVAMHTLGPAHSFLSVTLRHSLLAPNALIRCFKKVGRDEIDAANHLHTIERIFSFTLFFAYHVMSVATLAELHLPRLIGSYVSGSLCAALLSRKVMHLCTQEEFLNPSSHRLALRLSQFLGFMGGSYLFHHTWHQLKRTDNNTSLFLEAYMGEEGRERVSLQDAYDILGLPLHAEHNVVRKRYVELVRKFHPDNVQSGQRELFHRVSWAHHTIKTQLSLL